MTPIVIDISQFRKKVSKIADDVYNGKTYLVKKSDIPVMELVKPRVKAAPDPWVKARGGWNKFITDEDADKLIREIYELRRDGSSRKKTLWEQP